MKHPAFTLIFALVLFSIAGFTVAQPPGPGGEHQMRKVEQFKKMKLLETLDLDEATANKFLVRYDKWQKEIGDLMTQHQDLAMEMKIAMDRKSDDATLNGILDKLVDVTIKTDDAKHEMFKDLRTMLTPTQAVKLAVFEKQFQKKLHESIDKLNEGGHGRRD